MTLEGSQSTRLRAFCFSLPMKLRTIPLSITICLLLDGLVSAQTLEQTVDQMAIEGLKIWNVPGASIVIVQNDKTRVLKSYGKRQAGRPEAVTPDTVFPLGSCSKSFTTTVLAMLADEGKLAWDDPVRKHLPAFHLFDPRADALVTIRDLVSHRTGVANHDPLWYHASWSQEETVRRLAFVPPSGEFRSSYYYSTPQFMAAGQAAAKYHSKGWDGLVRERILTPLGLKHTYLTSTEALKDANHAAGHWTKRPGKIEAVEWYPQPVPNPAASVYITASDLGKWLQFQLGDGTWNGRRLVSSANLNETHKPNTLIPMSDVTKAIDPYSVQLCYAMGWVVQDYRGIKLLSHGGILDGFKVNIALLPAEQIGIGILANSHATFMNWALMNQILDFILNAPPKDWNAHYGELFQAQERAVKEAEARRGRERDTADKPSLSLQLYAGVYAHPAYGECRVECTNGELRWQWSSFQHVLEHYKHDTFEMKDDYLNDPLVEFIVENKQVHSMKFWDGVFVRKK
jgi:CubicO group peptidase (beta-lactamase class C family)